MKNLKKISALFSFALVALALAMTFSSCDSDDDNDNGLKFNPGKADVEVGKTVLVITSGGTKPYTLATSDAKIATAKAYSDTIVIAGVAKGSATITVTDKNKIVGAISVTVKEAASGLTFDKKTLEVGVSKEDIVTITGGTAPYSAEAKDATVATATIKDNKVTIKGVKAGSTTITVADKDKKNSGVISVTVK